LRTDIEVFCENLEPTFPCVDQLLTFLLAENAAFSLALAAYNLKSKARCGLATLRQRDQCGAMASSCGFASRKTTRPFFM
jgi:hypothetical protein